MCQGRDLGEQSKQNREKRINVVAVAHANPKKGNQERDNIESKSAKLEKETVRRTRLTTRKGKEEQMDREKDSTK